MAFDTKQISHNWFDTLFFFFFTVIRAENMASINTVAMGRKGLSCSSGLKIKIKTTTEKQLVPLVCRCRL